jgi:hypothetical protein
VRVTPDPRVKEFERQLDAALAARPMVRSGGSAALRLAADIVEFAAAETGPWGHTLATGLQVLAPSLIDKSATVEIRVSDILADLEFATHYHHLRDLLYYTYNAPGSVRWTFGPSKVELTFADESLPRQFYISYNNCYLDSIGHFPDEPSTRIRELIHGEPEFTYTTKSQQAAEYIQMEVDLKLELYFDLVSDMSVPAGRYTFGEFISAYRALLVKAIYHRYHAAENGARGALSAPLDDFARDLASSVDGLSEETARQILKDISYGIEARLDGLNPVYFSLYHLPDRDEIVMLPHDFALREGLVSFLRLIALRDPRLFLANFSHQIGDALVHRIGRAFSDAGFQVRTNVRLGKYDQKLPDIDLLVISQERTLGFAIIACEVKGPLPPTWAKDELRVLEPDSVSKAFEQLALINSFFGTDDGIEFLSEQLPQDGLPDFDEFAVLCWTVVATSANAGAFFAGRGTIIDFRTLTRLLSRCDGDMLYVLDTLKNFQQRAGDCFEKAASSVQVGDISVSYEGVHIKRLMDFPTHTFLSAGAPDALVAGMLETGARPLDVFRNRGEDFEDS